MVVRLADACTANSAATRKALGALDSRSNIGIIPMGVDTGLFKKTIERTRELRLSVAAGGKLILYAGRLIHIKGVDRLIHAMSAVIGKYPDARLVIVGNGPEKVNLLALSKKLGIEAGTFFFEEMPQTKLAEWYSAADLFVLPSLQNPSGEKEGQGVVILEAMACGLPVVGSNVGGIPSLVKHEMTGMLANPGDAKDLFEKICILLENDGLRDRIIGNARRMVLEQFTWETVAEKFIKTYGTVVGATSKPGHVRELPG